MPRDGRNRLRHAYRRNHPVAGEQRSRNEAGSEYKQYVKAFVTQGDNVPKASSCSRYKAASDGFEQEIVLFALLHEDVFAVEQHILKHIEERALVDFA